MRKKKNLTILIVLIILLISLDQIFKIYIKFSNKSININQGLIIEFEPNIEEKQEAATVIPISIIAILLIGRYLKSDNSFIKLSNKIVVGLLLSGVISNCIDNLWNGYTINYINIVGFSYINLSYIYFIATWIGMAMILTKFTIERVRERNEKRNNS